MYSHGIQQAMLSSARRNFPAGCAELLADDRHHVMNRHRRRPTRILRTTVRTARQASSAWRAAAASEIDEKPPSLKERSTPSSEAPHSSWHNRRPGDGVLITVICPDKLKVLLGIYPAGKTQGNPIDGRIGVIVQLEQRCCLLWSPTSAGARPWRQRTSESRPLKSLYLWNSSVKLHRLVFQQIVGKCVQVDLTTNGTIFRLWALTISTIVITIV